METTKILKAGAYAILTNLAVNSTIFFIGKAMGGFPEDFFVEQAKGPLTIVPIIFSSIIPTVAATLLYWLLAKFTAKADLIFRIMAAVVFVAMIYGPIGIKDAPITMIACLELMHLTEAIIITWFLTVFSKK